MFTSTAVYINVDVYVRIHVIIYFVTARMTPSNDLPHVIGSQIIRIHTTPHIRIHTSTFIYIITARQTPSNDLLWRQDATVASRREVSYTRLLITEHRRYKTPPGGGGFFRSICIYFVTARKTASNDLLRVIGSQIIRIHTITYIRKHTCTFIYIVTARRGHGRSCEGVLRAVVYIHREIMWGCLSSGHRVRSIYIVSARKTPSHDLTMYIERTRCPLERHPHMISRCISTTARRTPSHDLPWLPSRSIDLPSRCIGLPWRSHVCLACVSLYCCVYVIIFVCVDVSCVRVMFY